MQVLLANLEQNNSLENLDIDFEALKAVNWKENLPDIKVVLHDVITAYQVLDINPEDFKAVLKNANLQTQLDKVVTSILDCDIVSEYILPIGMTALCDMLSKQDSLLEFGFDFDQISQVLFQGFHIFPPYCCALMIVMSVLISPISFWITSSFSAYFAMVSMAFPFTSWLFANSAYSLSSRSLHRACTFSIFATFSFVVCLYM
jgi:hypothetical protein